MLPIYHPGGGYPNIFIESVSIEMPIIYTNRLLIDELIKGALKAKLIPLKFKQHLVEAKDLFDFKNINNMLKNTLIKFDDLDLISKKLIGVYLC